MSAELPGHWEGNDFIFDRPWRITVMDGYPVELERINTDCMVLPDGWTPDTFIRALTLGWVDEQ